MTGHICLSRSRLGTKLSVCAFVLSFIALSYARTPAGSLSKTEDMWSTGRRKRGSVLQTQGRRPNPAGCQQDSEDQDFAQWGKAIAVVARALRDA